MGPSANCPEPSVLEDLLNRLERGPEFLHLLTIFWMAFDFLLDLRPLGSIEHAVGVRHQHLI